ncbi:hypothetical protein CONCODRAFT_77416 [Conidiobolus coronatus NRRL 28638]|uniref:Small ribosomal subunit protein mS41 n=1 Tax=Conidiobolus coronatus (strain ATCC 28846 / CBS 209.66 / NRRL 28638) TaxID=796925 RepID=A0A137PED7_CONC2|nr:hypothetical protein CONCODRAFT_77416 [Conidiobolus coronatus NRRL 28638]|eukprot:KXN73374.1 hypothetical protein CONCODRAFT_77416 [Conidiobolus coronatus NRRL 28638]
MKVPFPTDACPDHATFLKTLGKEAEKSVDKFEGWNDLFKCKSSDMKEKGLTSKQRKLILDKAHKFVLGFEPTHKKKHKRGAKKNEIARMKAKSK